MEHLGQFYISRFASSGSVFGQRLHAIRLDSLNTLISRKQDWVNLKEARALLGISRKRAYALLEQGVLKPVSGPTVDGNTLWSFSRQDILTIENVNLIS